MHSMGPEPLRATSLCPGLPLAMFSTRGLGEGMEVTLVGLRAWQWAVATPTEFISDAISSTNRLTARRPGVHRQASQVTPLPEGDRKPPSPAWGCPWDSGSCSPAGSLCLLGVAQQVLAGLSC